MPEATSRFHVTTQEGKRLVIEAERGGSLMQALYARTLVAATCGGAASCGTCHVYFRDPGLAGTPTEDEGYMLEGLGEYVDIKEGSRLSCQVTVEDRHDGAEIEIAPDA